MEILLSSYRVINLPKASAPASEQASCEIPSIKQPSPTDTYVRWSTISKPGRLNSAARMRSAIAIPTEFAKPCPKGPVVVSTPGVSLCSGWPGGFECSCRKHRATPRSEEHTSELQSHSDLVCRLLLEKKTVKKFVATLRTIGYQAGEDGLIPSN